MVGPFSGHRTHERTLFRVAVAAATKNRDDPPPRGFAQCGEHIFQRVVGVGVIDKKIKWHPRIHAFQPSRHRWQSRQCADHRDRINPESQSCAHRRKAVVNIMPPGQRQGHLVRPPLIMQNVAGAAAAQLDEFRPQARFRAKPVSDRLRGGMHPSDQTLRPRIIDIDEGDGFFFSAIEATKEETFRVEICVEGFVVVEMILSQIGKDRDIESQPFDPALFQSVRGHLHDAGPATITHHPRHQSTDLDGFGGRAGRRNLLVAVIIDHRAQKPGFESHGSQQMPDQKGGRCFAIGSGDADNLERAVGKSVECPRHLPHRPARVGNTNGHTGLMATGQSLSHHRDRTAFLRRPRILRTVMLETRNGDKDISGHDLPGVMRQAGDIDLGVSHDLIHGDVAYEFA